MEITLTCPYCDREFPYNSYTAEKELSSHKATCTEKRYLGGELEIEMGDACELLDRSR